MEKWNGCKKEINEFIENENNSKKSYIDASLLCPEVILNEKCDANVKTEENQKKYEIDGFSLDYNITGRQANFQLTEEEEKTRIEKYQLGNPVQNTRIHCTSCNTHLGSALSDYKKIFVHQLLSVIICRACFEFYTEGTFSKDKDGMEMYCRWCGQGGEVFCCNKCPRVFCKLCIRLNFSSTIYADVRDNDYWECFVCNPSSMVSLKVQCYEFARYVRNELARLANLQDAKFYMDIDYSQCCTTPKRQKRKLGTPDPDFLPYSGEKSNKKPKIFTKNERDVGQISNLKIESNASMEFTSVPKCPEKKEKFKFSVLSANPSTSSTKLPATDPLAVPTTSIYRSTTPIILHRHNLHNPINFNQNIRTTKPVPIHLPSIIVTPSPGATPSTPTSIPSQNIVVPRAPPQSRQLLSITEAVSNFINSRQSHGVGSRIYFLRSPNGVSKRETIATNTQRIAPGKSSAQRENTNDAQLQSTMGKFYEREVFFNKSNELYRLVSSTAITSSSCNMAMMGIYQFYDIVNSSEQLHLVYESLQKSLKAMIDSLNGIKNELVAKKTSSTE